MEVPSPGSVSSTHQKEDETQTMKLQRLTRQIIAIKQFSFLSDPFVSQIQMGWFQHDLGHCSVFRKPRWNHLLQIVVINMLKVRMFSELIGTKHGWECP